MRRISSVASSVRHWAKVVSGSLLALASLGVVAVVLVLVASVVQL